MLRLLAGGALLALTVFALSAKEAPFDAAKCEESKLQSAQVRCFVQAAEARGDAAICETARHSGVRFNCLSVFAERTGDTAPCERVDGGGGQGRTLRDACIAGVAVVRREAALCERAQEPNVRDTCYMMLVVERSGDPRLCARIKNTTLRQVCTGNGQE